jgi:hypothetical protein
MLTAKRLIWSLYEVAPPFPHMVMVEPPFYC